MSKLVLKLKRKQIHIRNSTKKKKKKIKGFKTHSRTVFD